MRLNGPICFGRPNPWGGFIALTFFGSLGTCAAVWLVNDALPSAIVALVSLWLGSAPALRAVGMAADALDGIVARFVLMAHVLIGMAARLYEANWPYDKVIHLAIPLLIALRIGVAVRDARHCDRIRMPDSTAAIFVFAMTMTIGALWELFEFGLDATGYFVAQKGLNDTMGDLGADAIGASLGVIVAVYAPRHFRFRSVQS